jgi:capsular exopolysaccharide synthesis family protein
MDSINAAPPPETKLHFLDYWRIIRIRKTVILAVFLLVVTTATLVTFILPEAFSSTARIRVERDRSDIQEFTSAASPLAGGYDPFFMQTEFEIIKSETVLTNVIRKLELNQKWGAKYLPGGKPFLTSESLGRLKGMLDVRQVRNTSLIDVGVQADKPEDAAELANAIAEAYKDFRVGEGKRRSTGGIDALEIRFKEQSDKIKDQQGVVDRLREELKITDIMAGEAAYSPLITADILRRVNELRIQSKVEYVREDTLLTKLKELKEKLGSAKLAQAIPTSTQDPLLTSLLEQLNLSEQKLIMVQKDYGPEHSEVKAANKQVAELSEKVNQRVDGAIAGLEVRVASLKTALEKLEEEVTTATETDITKARTSRPYWDAKRTLDELLRFRQLLDLRITGEKIDVNLPKTTIVEIVEYAKPVLKAVQPNKPLNIALGIIIGLIVGVGLAFFIEYLDTSVKTIDDVERALQAPVLGVIPQNVGLMVDEGIESPHAEAYRVLRTNLLFSRKDDKLNSMAVVSAGAGEGKSTTVFNLAAIFAQSGQRVVLVDSDLRRPTLHKIFKVTNSIGLTNYLLKQNRLEEVIQRTAIPTLDFLASGKLPSSSLGILSSVQMRDLINELKARYDFVFFDSPPIMGVSDASILASAVDMTLQVIQYRRYPQPMNIRAKQLIEKVGGNMIGIVLNNINMSQDESYYYYSGYYHDYYYSHREDSSAAAAAGANGEKTDGKDKLEIKQKY